MTQSSLVALRSFVLLWLLAGITCASLRVSIESRYFLPLIQNNDFGQSGSKNSNIQESLGDSPLSSKHDSRKPPFDDLIARTYPIDKLLAALETLPATSEESSLFRRVAGTSSTDSSGSERESVNAVSTTNIYIVPYYRGRFEKGGFLPFHWAIFSTNAPNAYGTTYQLRGIPGEFRYEGPERPFIMTHSHRKRQELLIGRIPKKQINEMEAIIARVPISKSKDGFNCQTWAELVLQRLYQHGWLTKQPSAIVSFLKQQETVSKD